LRVDTQIVKESLAQFFNIGSCVDMAPGLRELIALSLLAGLGCGVRWPTLIRGGLLVFGPPLGTPPGGSGTRLTAAR